jgi:glucose-6-phosphate-specific signal transduction histidine kinase
MGVLAWTMMGLALWHFTIFIPDHFWGGIVGAFLGSLCGAILFGLAINGFSVPGQVDTTILTSMQAIPGSILGVAFIYWLGLRNESAEDDAVGGLAAE